MTSFLWPPPSEAARRDLMDDGVEGSVLDEGRDGENYRFVIAQAETYGDRAHPLEEFWRESHDEADYILLLSFHVTRSESQL